MAPCPVPEVSFENSAGAPALTGKTASGNWPWDEITRIVVVVFPAAE
jgi:hypothetical protein